jgi:hypothetical protein
VELSVVAGLSLFAVAATWAYCNVRQSRTRKELAKWAKKFEDQT